MLIHIERGKGGRDRYVPLSATLLETLRVYWRWMKPKTWLFPGTIAGWRADKPITPKVVWDACQSAATRAQIEKRVSAHLLAAFVRDPSAGGRRRLAHDPAAARSRQTRTHRDLSASVPAAPARGHEPAGHDAGLGSGHGASLASTAEAVTLPPFEVVDVTRRSGTRSETITPWLAAQHLHVLRADVAGCRTAALGTRVRSVYLLWPSHPLVGLVSQSALPGVSDASHA